MQGSGTFDNSHDKFQHGCISFILREVKHEYGQKYMRVPSTANPADIIVFMRDVWKLECPMIVLSLLTGRNTDTEWQSKKTMSAFKSAVKNAAVNTDMWVLTHGMNFGVTRAIGEAYNEELNLRASRTDQNSGRCLKGDPSLPLVLIGICPLSCVVGASQFQGKDVFYTIMGGPNRENQAELEPHHTHYILVDDEDMSTSYRPLNIRARIERKMVISEPFRTGRFTRTLVSADSLSGVRRRVQLSSTMQQDSSQTVTATGPQSSYDTSDKRCSITITSAAAELSSLKNVAEAAAANECLDEDKDMLRDVVPVVCMVIGGGLTTLRDIAERARLGIPLLICKGSGFGADTLAYTYEEYGEENDPIMESEQIKGDVYRRLLDAFPNTDQSTLDECLNAVMQIINCCRIGRIRSFVCDDSAAPFSTTILNIFDTRNWKTDTTRFHKELLLTLLKCQRVRRKHAPTREQVYRQLQLLLDWNAAELAQSEIFDREDMPIYAIPVHIFEQAFVRPKREAFIELFLDRNFQIQRFFTRARIRRWMILNQSDFFHEVCINQLLCDQDSLENYDSEDDLSPLINLVIYRLTGLENIFKPIELRTTLNDMQLLRLVTPETQTFTALTIVATLLNRHDLARILLKRSDSPITVALFCSMLYRRLSHFCRESFMKRKVREQSTEMSEYAVGMLDLCFQSIDHCSATEVLDQPHPDFNNLTTIQIAYKAKVLEFLSHPLCQRWISEKYYGGIRFLDLSFGPYRLPLIVKVLTCSILLVPSIWWVTLDYVGTTTEEDGWNDRQKWKKRFTVIQRLWAAPVTKFYFNLVAYLIFLLTLGFATLWPSCGNLLLDSFLGVWVCLMIIELSRCTYINYTSHGGHMSIGHNLLDVCLHFIFLLSFAWTRLLGNWNGSVSVLNSKFVMCLGVLYFTYRVPFVYMAISKTLGPQLVWIQYTITHDFADFVKLLLLAVFAGGVTINAMIYPFWPLDDTTFSRIVARAFLALFLTEKSDLEKDSTRTCVSPGTSSKICIEQSSGVRSALDIGKFTPMEAAYMAKNFSTSCPMPTFRAWVFVLQHFILMKLFLMTILYAMFNNSSISIAKYSSLVWMFKRYENVMAFERTRTLPPPLTVFFYLAALCKYVWRSIPLLWSNAKACLGIFQKERKFDKKLFGQLFGFNTDLSDSSVECWDDGQSDSVGKDNNYWRLLAQEYIGKREEGLLTITSSTDDSMRIRAKLPGDTATRHVEVLRAQITMVKEHVGQIEKSIDKLGEKMTDLLEHVGKLHMKHVCESDDVYRDFLKSCLRPFGGLCHDKHLYKDTIYDAQNGMIRWHSTQVVQLPCGAEKKLDRRSWINDSNSGLPVKYSIDQELKLPICPLIVRDDNAVEIEDLPLLGPNHEICVLLTNDDSSQCLLVAKEGLSVPKCFVQSPVEGHEKAVVHSILSNIFDSYSISSLIPIYRGFTFADKRNRWYAWVEVQFWHCTLLPDYQPNTDILWAPCADILPDNVISCLQ